MWFPGGHYLVSIWMPHSVHIDTTWFPHEYHMVSTWTPYGVQETKWKPAQKTALHEANWLPCISNAKIAISRLVKNRKLPVVFYSNLSQ